MQYLPNSYRAALKRLRGALRCESADSNDPFRREGRDYGPQVPIASAKQSLLLRCCQLVRRAIAAAALQKGQRTIIHHQMRGEETPRRPESFCE
jgi:hypothetical protein